MNSAGGGGQSGQSKPTIPEVQRMTLPENVRVSLAELESKKWNVSRPGLANGRKWINEDSQLPINPRYPKAGYYKEFDVNNVVNPRDAERFVIGKNGEIYYTNNHYGDMINGQPDFIRIK